MFIIYLCGIQNKFDRWVQDLSMFLANLFGEDFIQLSSGLLNQVNFLPKLCFIAHWFCWLYIRGLSTMPTWSREVPLAHILISHSEVTCHYQLKPYACNTTYYSWIYHVDIYLCEIQNNFNRWVQYLSLFLAIFLVKHSSNCLAAC